MQSKIHMQDQVINRVEAIMNHRNAYPFELWSLKFLMLGVFLLLGVLLVAGFILSQLRLAKGPQHIDKIAIRIAGAPISLMQLGRHPAILRFNPEESGTNTPALCRNTMKIGYTFRCRRRCFY